MRPIVKNDDEMLKTLILSARMSGKDKMSRYFKQKIDAGENPDDAWFYYGLNAWQMMNSIKDPQEKHGYLVEIIKGFSQACLVEAKHWPAIFLRSLIRIKMSGDEVEKRCFFPLTIEYSVKDAHEDLLKLIELQKETAPEPYYFSTYAAAAAGELASDNAGTAAQTIAAGLTEVPVGRVQYLVPLVSLPLVMLLKRLPETGQNETAETVKERYNSMFPGNKID